MLFNFIDLLISMERSRVFLVTWLPTNFSFVLLFIVNITWLSFLGLNNVT